MLLKRLVGSGDKIGLFALPFIVIGLGANLWRPDWFSVGGPSQGLRILSLIILVPGIVVWAWSVYLILARVPGRKLITNGPFSLVKHPLYTGVAFLVLPWIGFLCNSWLGIVVGGAFYVGRLLFAPAEEAMLSREFGAEWDVYRNTVKIPWL